MTKDGDSNGILKVTREGARDIINNQLDTYQHIQKLSQNTIRIVIAVVTFSLGLYYNGNLTVTLPEFPQQSKINEAAISADLPPVVLSEILLVNYLIGFLTLLLAFFAFVHSVELFTRVVRHSRLGPGLGEKDEEVVVELKSDDIFHSEITGIEGASAVSPLNYWIDKNKGNIQKADSMLYTGYGGVGISVLIAFFGLMVFDITSEVNIEALSFMNSMIFTGIAITVVLNPIKTMKITIGVLLSFYGLHDLCQSCEEEKDSLESSIKDIINHFPLSILSPLITSLLLSILALFSLSGYLFFKVYIDDFIGMATSLM